MYSDEFCVKSICTAIASRTPPLPYRIILTPTFSNNILLSRQIHKEEVHQRAVSIFLHALLLLRKDRSVRGPDSVLNHHSDDVHRARTEVLDVAKTPNLLMLRTKLASSFHDTIHNPSMLCSTPLHSTHKIFSPLGPLDGIVGSNGQVTVNFPFVSIACRNVVGCVVRKG